MKQTIGLSTIILAAFFAAPGIAKVVEQEPERDPLVRETEFDSSVFKADPTYNFEYNVEAQIEIYGGKTAVKRAIPPIESREYYGTGSLGEGFALFGEKNRLSPLLVLFGDSRTAVAFNDNGKKEIAQVATRLNLFLDLKLTATERVHMFWPVFADGAAFTRYEFGGDDRNRRADPKFEQLDEPTTLFFEGDLGAIISGLTDNYTSFDLPISFGRMPLLLQNGVWMEDAIIGAAFTIPAKNSPALGITNYDITFFGATEEVTSDAFLKSTGGRDDNEAALVGVTGFFDVKEGYLELGYAYLHDKKKSNGDHSYNNLTAAFTKRYGGLVSNSTRVIANLGQKPGRGATKTADGVLVISENAFITRLPLTLIPYANFWAGLDTPQSVARAGAAGGILRNVGLAFESDNLTGFPTLDPTGRDTVGGAIGIEYLFALDQQLVVEAATVVPWDDKKGPAKDNQYAFSARYQIPITNQVIFRADTIYGILEEEDNIFGARFEVRVKF